MKEFFKSRSLIQWLCLIGLVGCIFYFVTIIVQEANYPGYDPLSQAISDLSAESAPSGKIKIGNVYTICSSIFCILAVVFYQGKFNKVFRLGIYIFAGMSMLSSIGYSLFPLTTSGIGNSFQDVMHMVVTGLVVISTIASFVLLAIGFFKMTNYKKFGIITIVALGLLFVGAMLTGILPKAYFGIAERINVYSVVLYSAFLSVFTFLLSEGTQGEYKGKDIV